MRFRFTLIHRATSTRLRINEPDGWKQAVMKLARDKEFYSLIEFFDGSFLFYGDNGVVNGGIHFIENLEATYGPDVEIDLLIEIAPDNFTYEEVFSGQLDISLGERLQDNKYRIPVIRDNFWAKFNSRWQTPVDLQAVTDLDENSIDIIDSVDLSLLPQKVEQRYFAYYDEGTNVDDPGADYDGSYMQFTPFKVTLDELEEVFFLPTTTNPEIPVWNFEPEYEGPHAFDLRIEASAYTIIGAGGSPLSGILQVFFQINEDTPIAFTETDYDNGIEESTGYLYQDTVYLQASDVVRIYGLFIAPIPGALFFYLWGDTNPFIFNLFERFAPSGEDRPSYFSIIGQTIFPETTESTFLIHDAGAAILKSYGLGEDNPFYSELLGSQLTNARVYEADGCAWKYAVIKGLQLRGYELTDKPFFMSFEQWWKGINPILCLGLTYDVISSVDPEIAEVENVSDWDDAGGSFPGSWTYTSPAFPHSSIVAGGTEGYTCGLCATVAGTTYQFSVVNGVALSGSEPAETTFTWALLDASFVELATEAFNYVEAGFYPETFNMTPSGDGTYIAVRVQNNTPTQTKTVTIYWAIGGEGGELLLNPDFVNSDAWANDGSGVDWVIIGGTADLTLPSGTSKNFTQEFTNAEAGSYVIISRRVSTNFDIPTDSVNYSINVYDVDSNLITGAAEFITGNNTVDVEFAFDSVVAIAKIEIVAEINTGADIDIAAFYLHLFGPTIATAPTPEQRVIQVEEREQFFLPEMSVLISNVQNLTRKYDNDVIFNKIDIGYTQWQSEDISGIDDPQTKKVYSTRFQKIGQGIDIKSDFIAASLAIETTRRQTVEKSKDYKFDNNVFIIAINPDDISPDAYVPELDENFTSILNLLNSDTRYNIRLSVARNFLRWRKWFNGCLQNYVGSLYKFVSGEGNYDMITTMVVGSPDCLDEDFGGEELSEKQDIEVTTDIIHTPNYYEMEVPMEWDTYKTIRNNRRNAIGISQTDEDHKPLFIDTLDYEPMNGKAKIAGWSMEYIPIIVPEGTAATQDCFTSTECDNPITDELGEVLTDENGVCITA